jgi:hypothetical protein
MGRHSALDENNCLYLLQYKYTYVLLAPSATQLETGMTRDEYLEWCRKHRVSAEETNFDDWSYDVAMEEEASFYSQDDQP